MQSHQLREWLPKCEAGKATLHRSGYSYIMKRRSGQKAVQTQEDSFQFMRCSKNVEKL